MANEVIAAIATPQGRGGIGVVRVSGLHLESILQSLVGKKVVPRRATRSDFRAADESVIDQGLVLYFPAPHSYTGEEVIELQGHGGPAVLQLLLSHCVELGARIAEPGEFTKRAFLNDKIDLAQAESVADLINASTTEAARCAMRSLQGEFSRRIEGMVGGLVELRMLVEAALDFPDEDLEILENANLKAKLTALRDQLSLVVAASRQGSLLREGVQVVLAGQPNVGKSSLMNSLAGSEQAIVTDLPGTTRDAIRTTISVNGVPLHLIDTAGLREPQDEVERIGISKALEAVARADMVVWVSDATRPGTRSYDSVVREHLRPGVPELLVVNKIDITGVEPQRRRHAGGEEIWMSAKTGAGLEFLQAALLNAVGWVSTDEGVFMARARHMHAMHSASQHLERASTLGNEIELLAEELKLAQQSLASITGEFTADDLLGRIFSQFCIGK